MTRYSEAICTSTHLKETEMPNKRDALLDSCFVFMYLVALMGYMPTARGSDRYVWIGTLALLLLRTLWLFVKHEIHFSMDVNMFFYILLFLWGLLSCMWSLKIGEFRTYSTVAFPVVLCSVFCLGAYIGQRIDAYKFNCLIILAGLLAGIRYCIYTDWSGLSSDYYMRGTFGGLLDNVTNYNSYTMMITPSCVLSLYYAILENRKKFYIPAFTLAAILVMGGSRKNIVAIPLIAVIFTLFSDNGTKKLKKILFMTGAVLIGFYLIMNIPALSQIKKAMEGLIGGLFDGSEAQADSSTEDRLYLMKRAIEVWAEHPFIGVGWHNYRYYNDSGVYAHNNYAEMLASLGIVGFLIYYAMFIRIAYIIFTDFRNHRLPKEDILLLGFAISILIMEFGSITPYFKERMILILLIFYRNTYVTKRPMYTFLLK